MEPKISIIFPTYNNYSQTRRCLASIQKLAYPQNKIEIVVVDNGSTDQTVERLRKLIKQNRLIKLIENKKNLGFAQAVNIGIQKAKGEFIFITNNDVVLEKNSLTKLLDIFQKPKKIGLVGPKVLYQDSKKLAIAGFRVNPWLGYSHYDKSGAHQKSEVEYISGCGMLIEKNLFQKMGGFDPKYFFYYEDLDLCLRLKRKGYKIIYQPQAIIYHGYAKTALQQKPEKTILQGYKSRFHCLFKNASPLQILISLFSLPLMALYLEIKNISDPLVRGKIFSSMVKGYLYNLKNIRHILKVRKTSPLGVV